VFNSYVSIFGEVIMFVVNRWRSEPKECVVGRDSARYIHRKQVCCFKP